jgi:hypothetical protein
MTNARLARELSRPSEVPPVRPGLKAITVIWRALTSSSAAKDCAVSRLHSLDAE